MTVYMGHRYKIAVLENDSEILSFDALSILYVLYNVLYFMFKLLSKFFKLQHKIPNPSTSFPLKEQ